MQIILLSGGSGTRLWPISNDVRSKQFLKIFKTPDNHYESMLQRTLKQIETLGNVPVTVATSSSQEAILREYIDSNISISVEPFRRNTFPSIALAVAYLHEVKNISEDESIVVCPVDPYADDDFFAKFNDLVDQLKDDINLALLGINPTYPSAKYGYIIPKSTEKVSEVSSFKEKPDEETAAKYIEAGALWNGGVFAFKLGYVLKKSQELLGSSVHDELLNKYESLPNISFDYAVVEREKNIKVVRYNGEWRDIGTWNTLTEVVDSNYIGRVQADKTCSNLHVINETDLPIICMGLKDIVIAVSSDGILVSDKQRSAHIKPFVENIHN